jgi:hypothetical protein
VKFNFTTYISSEEEAVVSDPGGRLPAGGSSDALPPSARKNAIHRLTQLQKLDIKYILIYEYIPKKSDEKISYCSQSLEFP